MRLDEFLVRQEFFSSRTKAQRAIKAGQVLVNGKIVKKAGFRVSPTSVVVVTTNIYEKPIGYFKLKNIESNLEDSIFRANTTVLDIGSSAGGFVLYALERGASFVLGVEISQEFKEKLLEIKRRYSHRVEFLFGDAAKLDSQILQNYPPFDVITCDITTDPQFTFNIVKKYSPALKINGFFIFTLKLPKPYLIEHSYASLIKKIKNDLPDVSLNVVRIIPATDKHEIYVVAKRKQLGSFIL